MEDAKIIELYWQRSEDAIRETDAAYGKKLHHLADGVVRDHHDAQECVNDTYLKTWQTIPPQRPNFFFAYLAKICRHFAFGRLDWRNAAKRSADIVSLTAEMERCIPDTARQRQLESAEIGRLLNEFLSQLSQESRLIFLRRYWYADSIAEIAARYGISQSKVKTRLHRTRIKLHSFLEDEGVYI